MKEAGELWTQNWYMDLEMDIESERKILWRI